jgi:signal transduction histidine kinase
MDPLLHPVKSVGSLKPERLNFADRNGAAADSTIAGWKPISANGLFAKIPTLAISGEDSAVDTILFEVVRLLATQVGADIGQINLIARGGRVEKLSVVKEGLPWLRKDMNLHLLEPLKGFTGHVIRTGSSILIEDIWAPYVEGHPNPFLEIASTMNDKYLEEIKKPVASTIIVPVKRGEDIFCTMEFSRYRGKMPFQQADRERLDDFERKYGTLIMDYVIDVKNRVAVNEAHRKLLHMARLIASNRPVDYAEIIEPYSKLSSADTVLAFFKTGGMHDTCYRLVVWQGERVREILLTDFPPSEGSILRDDEKSVFPVEGDEDDERLVRFMRRVEIHPGIKDDDRTFVLDCLTRIRSYVVYPLHMLSQELGAFILGSFRPQFWQFLHMNPFLALYNSLLKSFLLNERLIYYLSDVSLRVHNPGFYCLGVIKTALARTTPPMLNDPGVLQALGKLDDLLNELHDRGRVLRWRRKRILLTRWLKAFVNRKTAQFPWIIIELRFQQLDPDSELRILATDEQLETIFENLISNSVRAITARQCDDYNVIGRISILVRQVGDFIEVTFEDNGIAYPTVTGRGVSQIREEIEYLGGHFRVESAPYRSYLSFPITPQMME